MYGNVEWNCQLQDCGGPFGFPVQWLTTVLKIPPLQINGITEEAIAISVKGSARETEHIIKVVFVLTGINCHGHFCAVCNTRRIYTFPHCLSTS